MKNVLILSSSPRRGGNSDTLCDEFMQGAIESGHRVEKVFLRDKTIHPCTGCGVCSQYKKPCPQKDDAAEIIGKMLAADVIEPDRERNAILRWCVARGRDRREPDLEASIRAGKTSIILLIATNTFGYNPYKRPTSMGSEYGSPFLRDLFLVLQLYPFREDRESRRVGRRTWQRKREGCPLLPK